MVLRQGNSYMLVGGIDHIKVGNWVSAIISLILFMQYF